MSAFYQIQNQLPNFEVYDNANPVYDPQNPYVGWWKLSYKNAIGYQATNAQVLGEQVLSPETDYTNVKSDNTCYGGITYMYINTTETPDVFSVTTYGGLQLVTLGYSQVPKFYQLMDDGVSIVIMDGDTPAPFPNYAQYSQVVNNNDFYLMWFTVQPDHQSLIGYWQGGKGNMDPTRSLETGNIYLYQQLVFERAVPPLNYPYNLNENLLPSLQTPTALFQYFYDIMVEKGFASLNPNVTDSFIPDLDTREAIFQSYLTGKTNTYPIRNIVKSTTGVYSPYTNTNTQTFILLGTPHTVTQGSTITFSGFANDWAVLNNTYNNSVIIEGIQGYQSSSHLDLNAPFLTGTFYQTANWFTLNVNTSARTAETTGPFKGWAKNFGSPSVTVTHHVTDDMSYNNFVACVKALYAELFKYPETHGAITFSRYSSRQVAQNFSDGPLVASEIALRPRWRGNIGAGDAQYAYARPIGTNNAIVCDHYNIIDNIATQIPDSEYNGLNIPVLNYLDEAYNIYYGFTGDYMTGPLEGSWTGIIGALQRDACAVAGLVNQGNPSIIGGGVMVATGSAYYGGEPVDHTIWQIAGNYADPDGFYDIFYYNYFVYGLVKTSLTPGKKVGYIFTQGENPFVDDSFLNWPFLTRTDVQQDAPNAAYLGPSCVRYLPAFKYFNAQGCDAVIIDNRSNGGGFPGVLEGMFGGDRNSPEARWLAPNNPPTFEGPLYSLTGAVGYGNVVGELQTLKTEGSYIQSKYGSDSVFKGSLGDNKKVVLLNGSYAYSGGVIRSHFLLGDNNDGNIGSYTKCKIVGLNKSYMPGASQPSYYRAPNTYLPNPELNLGDAYFNLGLAPESNQYVATKVLPNGTYQFATEISAANAVGELSTTTYPYTGAVGNRALPMSVETTVYPDFGFCANDRPILPGWTGPQQPDKNDYTTWRDRWFETAIQEALSTQW